jgi:hypothetical protein
MAVPADAAPVAPAAVPRPAMIDEPESDDPDVVRPAAEKLMAAGELDRAASYLLRHPKVLEGDPATQMMLGHAACRSGRIEEGLKAYHTALELQPDLSGDRQMRGVLLEVAQSQKLDQALAALRLAGLDLFIREARDLIAQRAAQTPDPIARERYRALATEGRVPFDRFNSLRLDLEQQADCRELKGTVDAIGALKDRRSIAVLQRALVLRPGEDEKTYKKRFACMQKPVANALKQFKD